MVKIAPRMIVRNRAVFAFLRLFLIISWWDQVTVTPEERRRMVFSKGILIGLKEVITVGGQFCPSSMVGEILLWKKAQKKETKNRISEVINRIIPVLRPFMTCLGCSPCSEASRWTSRHQVYLMMMVRISATKGRDFVVLFIKIRAEDTKARAPFEARMGQGLMVTKWKGLNFCVIILLL